MPAIADQVAALEHDHDDALALIDTLTAANAALIDALNAAKAEKSALEAEIAERRAYADAMATMAEKLANDALNLLKATRLPAGTPQEVIPFAPRPKVVLAAAPVLPASKLAEAVLRPKPAPQAGGLALPSPEPHWSPRVESESAIDRVKRCLLPSLGFVRQPDGADDARARHDFVSPGLPKFLRRDTTFARAA